MNIRTKLAETGAAALIALFLSLSLAEMALAALGAAASTGLCVLCCAAAVAVCAAFLLGRKIAVGLGAALALGGAAAIVFARGDIAAALKETAGSLGELLVGARTGLSGVPAMTAVVCVCVLMGVISFLLVRVSGGVYPAALMFLLMLLGRWLSDAEVSVWTLVPGLIALAVLYARSFREAGAFTKALPAAAAAVLIAALLVPKAGTVWPPLQGCADKVREMFNDYFLFDDPRTVYSVSRDGMQTLSDRLGGPADPKEQAVMTVETDTPMLLRGALSRTYTGTNWVDETVNSRYLYRDPSRRARREAAFDADLAGALKNCVTEAKARVTFESEGTSTLFVPHRLTSLDTPLDVAVYYNDTGEVFTTRNVAAGDSYSLTALCLNVGTAELAEAVNAASEADDPDYETACADYLGLPACVEGDLYWLLMDMISGCETPFERAMAIRDSFSEGYVYTLDGAYPPEGRDFVSWFVLDEKKGCCTYYASAMAVLARLAGIPSRYAEGYRVKPDESGTAVVTGEDAHAWAELYFKGVGWIEFDVTPGDGGDGRDEGNDQPDESDAAPEPTPTPTPEPNGGEEESTPSPEPDGTPEPEEDETSEPEATPEPEDEPENEPEDEPDDEPEKKNPFLRALLTILLLILLLLALAAVLYDRLRRRRPEGLAARTKDGRARVMIWYRAILTLLEREGMAPEGGETPSAFARRITADHAAPDGLNAFAARIERMQYAGEAPTAEVEKQGRAVFAALEKRMSRRSRAAWQWHILRRGIGDYRQVP